MTTQTFDTRELDGGVIELTLSRPEVLNRFDGELHQTLTEELARIRRRDEIRSIVILSTGRVFSAGGDMDLMQAAHDDGEVRRKIIAQGRDLFSALLGLEQPVVVGLQGAAIGLGATIALTCDAVVACRSASIADTHVNVGLVAGDGGCVVWPQAAGMLRARRHLLTGDPLSAEDAYTFGLVTDLVDEPDEVADAARALAGRIAQLPPLAVRGTKQALNRVAQQRFGEVYELSASLEEATLASDDLVEAIAAFREKRPAAFVGR
jgi:enoyl-CoA hydratase